MADRYYDNDGRRRRESYSTEAKAEKALKTKLALKETGKLDPADSRATIDSIAILYLADRVGTAPKSYSWLDSVWKTHLKPFFGGFLASRINTEKLVEYRNERLEAGASPTTVNKELSILRSIFNHGFEDYTPPKISRVPKFPSKLAEPPPRQGFLTDAQYDSLQAHAKHPWLKALLAMAYTFGFRRAELVGRPQRNHPPMRVKQVDLQNRTIHLFAGETKNDEGRVVKMTDEVYNHLRVCVEGKSPGCRVHLAGWSPSERFSRIMGQGDESCGRINSSARLSALAARIDSVANFQDVAKRVTGHKRTACFPDTTSSRQ